MDLSDVIDEMEEASSRADEAKDLAESAVDQLKEKLEEINQLNSDWKEYLDEHVTCDEVADWLVDNGHGRSLDLVARASPSLAAKRLESEQVQAVYWEEVEANRLGRALMFAAFLQERAGRQTEWVKSLMDKAAKKDANANRLNELEGMMKRVQSEIAEMRGDANE